MDKYDELVDCHQHRVHRPSSVPDATPFGPFSLAQKMTRTNYFADVSMNLLLIKLVGEVGQVSGGTLSPAPFNTFSTGAADDKRLYGSVGLRFNW